MGKKNINKKNRMLSIVCGVLLICIYLIYSDNYKVFDIHGKETVTIGVFSDSYWEVQNGYSYRILEDAIAVFEKEHPGVQVEYTSGILKEDYSEWLSEQLLAGDGPDVFFVLADNFTDFAEIGVLKELDTLINTDPEFDEKVFYSSSYSSGQYEGSQYSLPYECAPKLMFVNRTILDREGVDMPDEDWDWDEFYEICKKVTRDTDGNGTIDQFGVVEYTWKEAFESNDVKLFDEYGTECYLTGDNVGEALSFLEKMKGLNGGYNVLGRDFDLGNVAFQPMLFSRYRAYKPYPLRVKKYASFEWECIPMPSGPMGDNISALDTLLIGMNEKTRCPQYAWDLIKILTCDPQIQSEIFSYSEGVSVLKEVTEVDRTLLRLIESTGNSEGLNLEMLSRAVENAVVVSQFRDYDQAMAEVERAVNAIINGDSNISMEQIIWNREVNKYLEK